MVFNSTETSPTLNHNLLRPHLHSDHHRHCAHRRSNFHHHLLTPHGIPAYPAADTFILICGFMFSISYIPFFRPHPNNGIAGRYSRIMVWIRRHYSTVNVDFSNQFPFWILCCADVILMKPPFRSRQKETLFSTTSPPPITSILIWSSLTQFMPRSHGYRVMLYVEQFHIQKWNCAPTSLPPGKEIAYEHSQFPRKSSSSLFSLAGRQWNFKIFHLQNIDHTCPHCSRKTCC